MISQYLQKYNLLFGITLLILSAFYITYIMLHNYSRVTEKFNANVYKEKFENSQWRNPLSKAPISDETLYTHAGYRYMQGENPILISPEAPPLGKYIIGLFIVLFKNHYLASLSFGIGSLLLAFFITRRVTNSFLASSLAVFLSTIHPLFADQLIHSPQLDIFHLFFFLLFLYLCMLYINNNKKMTLIFAGIVFGLFISTKIFLLSFLMVNGWLVLSYLIKRIPIKKTAIDLGIINMLGLLTFTLTYFQYFLHGGTLRGLLGVQKWIYLFYAQSNIQITKLLGNYLWLIYTGKWHFWSEGYPWVSYEQWTYLWPIVFSLGIISMAGLVLRYRAKIPFTLILLVTFLLIYNVFLFIVPMFPRYLLLLYFPLNIIIASYFAKLYETTNV